MPMQRRTFAPAPRFGLNCAATYNLSSDGRLVGSKAGTVSRTHGRRWTHATRRDPGRHRPSNTACVRSPLGRAILGVGGQNDGAPGAQRASIGLALDRSDPTKFVPRLHGCRRCPRTCPVAGSEIRTALRWTQSRDVRGDRFFPARTGFRHRSPSRWELPWRRWESPPATGADHGSWGKAPGLPGAGRTQRRPCLIGIVMQRQTGPRGVACGADPALAPCDPRLSEVGRQTWFRDRFSRARTSV